MNEMMVDEAIAAVMRQPLPEDVMQRMMDRAAEWDEATPVNAKEPSGLRKWMGMGAGLAISAMVVLVGIWKWNGSEEGPVARSVTTARVERATGATAPNEHEETPLMAFRIPVSMIRAYAASQAPILVSYGGDRPLRWGTKVPHAEVNRGLAPGMVRLHVWDWTKSEESRVLVAKGKPGPLHFGAVSPQGTFLLGTDGVAIDLASGETTAHAGFDVIAEERIHQMRFSPSGRYVLARLVQTRMERVPSPASAPLLSNHHTWTLRVIDLQEDRIVKEYASEPLLESVALADEASLVCVAKDGRLCRQNYLTGEVMQRFEPALDPSGIMEVVASPDGKRIAASYLEEVIVWDVDRAEPLFRQKMHEASMPKESGTRVKGLLFSAKGDLLTLETGFCLFMLEGATGKRVAEFVHSDLLSFEFRQWSAEGDKVFLTTPTMMTDTTTDRFPPQSKADLLPKVYAWEWKTGTLEPVTFAKRD